MMRLTTLALWAALAPHALPREVHFSPEERLNSIDAGLLGAARQSIDFASYTLTDPLVLVGARIRGPFRDHPPNR